MKRTGPQENTARVLALASAAWAAFAGLSTLDGAPLAAFAALYALLTYVADRRVHAYLASIDARHIAMAAIVLVVAWPFAPVTLAPIAVLAVAASIETTVRRLRSGRATSPGATPAAT